MIFNSAVIVISLVAVLPIALSEEEVWDETSVFGFGAEDNEDNTELHLPWKQTISKIMGGGHYAAAQAMKKTRQDPEDIEWILNPGPMVAPDIILKQFVDSRVSLTNLQQDASEMLRNNSRILDPNMPTMDEMMSDDLNDELGQYATFNEINTGAEGVLKTTDSSKCFHMVKAGKGTFPLSLDKDCLIHIANPDKDSRLILTCAPIPLASCSTHKDSVAINLLGDMSFGKNSFLYCGDDANIRANSIRNELSIRIKPSNSILGTTQCSFHSRKYRNINVISPSNCGQLGRIGKIIGGRTVPPGLFPWAVQLDITRVDGSQTGCTGTIVAPYYVLTAAHCMKRAESVSAFVGGTDRRQTIGSEVLIQAEKYILHKKWSQRTLVADIALVKLTEPVEYSEDISPICLPEGKLLTEDMSGKRAVALGWGRTETRKKAPRKLFRVKLPLLSEPRCKSIYRRFFIPKMMMCTDSKRDSAICYGDSGGPLMYKRRDKVYQIGVASFSLSRTCGASPDVFTKTGEFAEWVEKRVNGIPQDENE